MLKTYLTLLVMFAGITAFAENRCTRNAPGSPDTQFNISIGNSPSLAIDEVVKRSTVEAEDMNIRNKFIDFRNNCESAGNTEIICRAKVDLKSIELYQVREDGWTAAGKAKVTCDRINDNR